MSSTKLNLLLALLAALCSVVSRAQAAEASAEAGSEREPNYGAPSLRSYGAPPLPAPGGTSVGGAAPVTTFSSPGVAVLAVENMLSYSSSTTTIQPKATPGAATPDVEWEVKESGLSFIGSDSLSGHSLPRIGLDVFVTEMFSLGGSLGYSSRSGKAELVTGDPALDELETPTTTQSTFVFGPRLGIGPLLRPHLALWLRGGPVWVNRKETIETQLTDPSTGLTRTLTEETMLKSTALALRGDLVLLPGPHFGVILGPQFHIPLSGSVKTKEPAADGLGSVESKEEVSARSLGVYVGIFGWFGG